MKSDLATAATAELYRLIVFDWDETAAPDSQRSSSDLAAALERLLLGGAIGVAVTRGSFERLSRLCFGRLSAEAKLNLRIVAHRAQGPRGGADVVGFDPDGHPRVLERGAQLASSLAALLAIRNLSQRQAIILAAESASVGGVHVEHIARSEDLRDITRVTVRPRDFDAVLNAQIELIGTEIPARDPSWILEQQGFDPAREPSMEPLFAVGNGYLGARVACSLPLPTSEEDLIVAGVYDQKIPRIPYSETVMLRNKPGESIESEIVALPSPFRCVIKLDGEELTPAGLSIEGRRRILDFTTGTVFERLTLKLRNGKILHLRTARYASLSDPHLIVQQLRLISENVSGLISLHPTLHARDLSVDHPHLRLVRATSGASAPEGVAESIVYRTHKSDVEVAVAEKVFLNGHESHSPRITAIVEPSGSLFCTRLVSVQTSRDTSSPEEASYSTLRAHSFAGIPALRGRHVARWDAFWRASDVLFDPLPNLTRGLRFASYQMRLNADSDPRVSVPAKGLTGRAYEGHIFWDADTWAFPFYLYTCPELARNIILYRHHTLPGARKRARSMGYDGACYAWESTITGADVTPRQVRIRKTKQRPGTVVPIYTGDQQIHVTADVAHAVRLYWEATLDEELLRDVGAEILFETARFWKSRCIERDGGYHIEQVVGPDEYHHSVNDNAYTNWMARENVEFAVWVGRWMQVKFPDAWKSLQTSLSLGAHEFQAWERLHERLFVPGPNEKGLIEQFAGFFGLAEPSQRSDSSLRAPIARLMNWDLVNNSKIIKQADVLMLPFLFPEKFSEAVVRANYDYYLPLTDHGSSLSPCVHAAIAMRLGRKADLQDFGHKSVNLDLLDLMRNTSLGVHIGAMGGLWQTVVFHFLGVRFGERGPELSPNSIRALPGRCDGVALELTYRGKRYSLRLSRSRSEAPRRAPKSAAQSATGSERGAA